VNIFDHTSHKAIWNYVVENRCNKGFAQEKLNLPLAKYYHCYACEYAVIKHSELTGQDVHDVGISFILDKINICHHCPLEWPEEYYCKGETSFGGLYNRYLYGRDEDSTREMFAAQIRDLPVKEGVVTK